MQVKESYDIAHCSAPHLSALYDVPLTLNGAPEVEPSTARPWAEAPAGRTLVALNQPQKSVRVGIVGLAFDGPRRRL